MKTITLRYKLKAKNKVLENRTKPEMVMAEVSGAFTNKVDGIRKYKKFQYSLEVSILPKYFGTIRKKRGVSNFVYDPVAIKTYEKYNKLLRRKIADFESNIELVESYFRDTDPSPEEVKEYLNKLSGREKRQPTETFIILHFLKQHISYLESLIGSGRKEEIKDNSINGYRNLIPIVERFQEVKKTKLTFSKLTEETYRQIWQTANDIRTGKIKVESYRFGPQKPLAVNTIKSYQTYLILLCKIAKKQNISIPLDLTDSNLINVPRNGKTEKTEAFLKEEDLTKVMQFEPKTEYQNLAKIYIIIASLTGMRLQSMREAKGRKITLCDESIKPFFYIHTIQEKTGTQCYTPLFQPVVKVLQNYDDCFPDFSKIALHNLNLNIRKVLKNSKIQNESLFSTHNLRSTFVSNLSILGLSETVISYVTHPSKKNNSSSVHIYDRRNMLDKAIIFSDEINRVNKTKKSKFYNLH